jgi:hypothetical protein
MPAPGDLGSMTEASRARPGNPLPLRQLIGVLEAIARHLPTVGCAFELATGTHGTPIRVHHGLVQPLMSITTDCSRRDFAGLGAGGKTRFSRLRCEAA